jgi:phosphopantetheinyl transferase
MAAARRSAEQKRAARFLFDRNRRLYLSAHALKRLMLTAAARGAVTPGAWTLKTDGQGKPRVACGAARAVHPVPL